MSSFAAKRAQRDSKRTKSFVQPTGLSSSTTDTLQQSTPPNPQDPLLAPTSSFQVSHPGLYTSLSNDVELRSENIKGRGIYAKKGLKRGTVILAQRPYIISISTPNLPSYCSYCARPSSGENSLKRCTKCKILWYCSSICQNADWAVHKHECPSVLKWTAATPDNSPPGEAVRTLGRILWGRKVQGEESTWWKEIQALQSHRATLPRTSVASYTQLAHSLVRYLSVDSPAELAPYGLTSASDIVDLISKFTTNTFTLSSPTLAPLGTCVSPTAALYNHSCRPNAVIVFPRSPNSSNEEPGLHVIAIRDIEPGEEILTSYVDTTLPTEARQTALKETYNFTCLCPVCSTAGSALDPREIVLCPKSCGGVCSAPIGTNNGHKSTPWRCTSCKAPYTASVIEDVEDKRRLGQDALDKATRLQFSDPQYALKLTTNLLSLLFQHVPPSAHPVLALSRLHQSLLIDALSSASEPSSILDDAIRATARVVSGLTAILDEGHPVRAIALAELGKLLAVDEPAPSSSTTSTQSTFPPTGPPRLKLAFDTLKRALNELMIGFGESTRGGETGLQIREQIVVLEKEIGVWSEGIRNVREDMRGLTEGKKSEQKIG